MSATPLPRSLRLTRHLTRGVLLATTAGTGVVGLHLAADQPRHTAAARPGAVTPAVAPTPATPTPAATPSSTPSRTASPATPRRAATPTPRASSAAPVAPVAPVAPLAPATGSGTGGGTTHGS